jgi:hypothetical protein
MDYASDDSSSALTIPNLALYSAGSKVFELGGWLFAASNSLAKRACNSSLKPMGRTKVRSSAVGYKIL